MATIVLACALAVAGAAVPTAIYVSILWWFDRYEKEPVWLFALAFIWGAVPAIVAALLAEAVLNLPLAGYGQAGVSLADASVVAPLVEEGAKGLALAAIFLLYRSEFDDLLDGIIYGAAVGFGFAMTENVLYYLASLLRGGLLSFGLVWTMRTVVFGLNHALFSAVMGAGFGVARLARQRWQRWLAPLGSTVMAVTLHAVHNLFAGLAQATCWPALVSLMSDWGGLCVLLVVVVLCWRQERRWLTVYLRPEVEQGLITADEYATVRSSGRRLGSYWEALSRQGWAAAWARRRRTAWITELAFRKHQLATVGSTAGEGAAIDKLRALLRGV